jgi:hypothetical protein
VLNARDPLGALAQLREWQSTLEGAVDEVVGTHHNSFSRSIQNYADIVHLFEDSRHNVSSLRAMFDETQTRLAAGVDQRGAVETAWCQSVVLQELTKRLDEIERLTRVPEKIRSLLSNGQHLPAVELAVKSCSNWTSPEYAMVDVALQDLRRECTACREIVRNQVHSELDKTIFCRQLKCRRTSETLLTCSTNDRGRSPKTRSEYDDLSSSGDEDATSFTFDKEDEFLLEMTCDAQDEYQAGTGEVRGGGEGGCCGCGDGQDDGWHFLLDASRGDSERQPESEETSELPTFVFQGARVCGGGDDDINADNDRKHRAANNAVYIAAQHLQAALGISTMPHLGHFDVHLVRELLTEITPQVSSLR